MPELPDFPTPLTPDGRDAGPPLDLSTPTAFAIEAIRADERERIGQAVEALPTSGPVSFLGIAEVRTLSADKFKADVLELLRRRVD